MLNGEDEENEKFIDTLTEGLFHFSLFILKIAGLLILLSGALSAYFLLWELAPDFIYGPMAIMNLVGSFIKVGFGLFVLFGIVKLGSIIAMLIGEERVKLKTKKEEAKQAFFEELEEIIDKKYKKYNGKK